MKKCIICEREPTRNGSHIVPASLIKNCVGKRYYETSFKINNLDQLNTADIDVSVYFGRNNQKNRETILNKKELNETVEHPYAIDYILCNNCEEKLGKIEGIVHDEIISKIKNDKFKSNFRQTNINGFEILISNKVSKKDLEIYFYSIILRICAYEKIKSNKELIPNEYFFQISKKLNNLIYDQKEDILLNTGLLVYLTNNPLNFPSLKSKYTFEGILFFTCEFLFILEYENNTNTLFGSSINKFEDKAFKFIKNSENLDETFSFLKAIEQKL